MIVRAKEKKEIFFKDIEVGQTFRDDEIIYMKINLEDDSICCPRCGEDFNINDEKGTRYAVDLFSGLAYEFELHSIVEIVRGAFIEE